MPWVAQSPLMRLTCCTRSAINRRRSRCADAWRLPVRHSVRAPRCTPPAPRADNGSTHEPSDRHRSDPSSLAAPAGSPASSPGLEHGCEYHEPSALDAIMIDELNGMRLLASHQYQLREDVNFVAGVL